MKFIDEVGRDLTTDTGVKSHTLDGLTNEAVNYQDADLVKDEQIAGYSKVIDNTYANVNFTLNGKTDQQTSGTITAPTGYEISNIATADGVTWSLSEDKQTATYTVVYDATADTDKSSQATVITYADGTKYDTMAEALAATSNFDNTNNGSGEDSDVQKFVITYVADDQTATITQQYADGATNTPAFPQADDPQNTDITLTQSKQQAQFEIDVPDGATSVTAKSETIDGLTGDAINAPTGYTDADLATPGYTYTVTGPTDTQNGKTAESYGYTYTAPSGYYVSSGAVTTASGITADIATDGKTVSLDGNFDNSTNTGNDGTDTAAIDGSAYNVSYANDQHDTVTYTLTMDDTDNGNEASDKAPQNLVITLAPTNQKATVTQHMPDGTTTVNNASASDSAAQDFTLQLSAASQSGQISFVYSGAIGSPTTPDPKALSGVTGYYLEDIIKAPEGYYIVDYQSANISFDGAPMSSIAAAGVTSGVYTSTYTAPEGYYFKASGQPSGASVAADGRTATFTFTYDNTSYAKTDTDLAVDGYQYNVSIVRPDGTSQAYANLSAAVAAESVYDNTINGDDQSDSSAQSFIVSYKASPKVYATLDEAVADNNSFDAVDTGIKRFVINPTPSYQESTLVVSSDSPISAGSQIETASGVTKAPITAEVVVGETGDEYSGRVIEEVTGDTGAALGLKTTDESLRAMQMTHGYTYNVTVQNAEGTWVTDETGVSFATTDSALNIDGYRYIVKTPNGNTYNTLASALTGMTGLYDNTNNAADSDAEPQTYTVEYSAITHSTLSAAIAANTVYDNTNNTGSSDAAPQVFTVSYIADYQSANLVIGGATQISSGVTLDSAAGVTSGQMVSYAPMSQAATIIGAANSPIQMGKTIESASGLTGSAISFSNTDATLARSGYRYVVYMGSDSATV
ncbi:hypothetical protein H7R52_02610 [Weissella confusa]|uniref:Uncharacterized protein n=1 Tax=Weissella confusa TaxID=1583 RepID=A0A923ND11_WEICO|nr:hypothetical protein [Weissella confusa]